MSILYIASPWKYRSEAKQVAQQFRDKHHQIISRWHDLWADQSDLGVSNEKLREEAEMDIADVRHAECVVVLNWEKSEGKAVEQGIALALGIPVLVIGAPSNVFHYLPAVRCVSSFFDALIALEVLG